MRSAGQGAYWHLDSRGCSVVGGGLDTVGVCVWGKLPTMPVGEAPSQEPALPYSASTVPPAQRSHLHTYARVAPNPRPYLRSDPRPFVGLLRPRSCFCIYLSAASRLGFAVLIL
jgi:hypothetical protein